MNRSSSLAFYFEDGARIVLQLFAALALGILFVYFLTTIPFPFPLDYGEGPLLDQAIRLSTGENIYRPDLSSPPFTIANYPPLFVLLNAPLVKAFGPSLINGRLISLLSALVSALFLALIVRHGTRDRLATLTTVTVFLASPFVAKWSVFNRIDLLALALSTAALYVILRRPDERRGLLLSGLLLVAAIFTRQSYALAAPLAAFVWLWTRERKRAVQLALLVAGLSLILFLLLNVATSGGFYLNIVRANINEFGLDRLNHWIGQLTSYTPILIALSLVFLIIAPGRLATWPLLVAYLVGASLSALTIGKIGSNANYLLELSAAFSLVAGALIAWCRSHPWRLALLALALSIQVGMLISATLDDAVAWSVDRRQDEEALRELKELIAASPDPVLADEYMGMISALGRPLYLQPFELTQLSRQGVWDQAPLVTSIENQEFPLIVIFQSPFWPLHEERWTAEMLSAVDEHYRPAQTLAGNILYRPGQVVGESTTYAPARNPSFEAAEMQLGEPQQIGQANHVMQPSIVANLNQPQHLAAIVTTGSNLDCYLPACQLDTLLYVSLDGGRSWSESKPFSGSGLGPREKLVRFGPADRLYALGLRQGIPLLNSTNAAGNYQMTIHEAHEIRTARNPSKPWLSIDPESGRLYLSYAGRERKNISVRLNVSDNGGATWSSSIEVDPGVPQADIQSGQAMAADDVQVLIGNGENLSVVWRWRPGFQRWPQGVWLANSTDGGQTFTPPRRIAQTWGPINSAFHDGRYYVLYRHGSDEAQELVLAISDDAGISWRASVVSGDLRLSPDFDKVGGIGVSPGGLIDIVFYSVADNQDECVRDQEQWLRSLSEGYVDTCSYDVFYTYSRDGGETFSEPRRLNDAPIDGGRFVRLNGYSFPFTHLAVASTDDYAYPIWVDTPGDEGSQLFVRRIAR